MPAHPTFADLQLHSDDELTELLGSGITARRTIHEWPLSCVQELRLSDGRRLVYKSQLPPSVETDFYAQISSPLLPGHRGLGRLGECQTMVIDWIDSSLLDEIAHADRGRWVEHGRRIVAEIGRIGTIAPVYLDVGTRGAWSTVARCVLDKLDRLVADGRFQSTSRESIGALDAWVTSRDVVEAVEDDARVIHGDLKADQIFSTPDGYKIIDWQRPMIAPPDVDLVSLLVDQGIDPREFVHPVVVDVFWFLRLNWAVVAAFDLFPTARWPVFDRWAAEAVARIAV